MDIVFITGDVAFNGQISEYELFLDKFIFPLIDVIGSAEKIFIVPGNHDVDREQAKPAARYDLHDEVPEFFDPNEEGLSQRRFIFPRFDGYSETLQKILNPDENWIFSTEGVFTRVFKKEKMSVGIMGINTAWLAKGKGDKEHLSPGKNLVESGLEKISEHKFKIVIGHHPLDWLDESKSQIRALFAQNNVIYLHGHLHKTSARPDYGAGRPFLTLQAGAAFQAREDEKWINRLLWCELDSAQGQHIDVQPMQWNKDDQEWVLDGMAYSETLRIPETDTWRLPLFHSNPSSPVESKQNSKPPHKTGGFVIPDGWRLIDKEFLNEIGRELDDEELLRFFDGRAPKWSEAVSPRIPRRTIVQELLEKL